MSAQRTLRIGVPSGLLLAITAVAYTVSRFPGRLAARNAPAFLLLFAAGVVWYLFAAIRWTQTKTDEDRFVLRWGLFAGIATGAVWTVEVLGGNVIIPHQVGARIGALAAGLAFMLPLVAGALGARKTGKIFTGARLGFWCGVVSGLIAFSVLVAVGYLVALVPGYPGFEAPMADHSLTAAELSELNVGEFMGAAISHLFLIGAIYCSLAGTIGASLRNAVFAESSNGGRPVSSQ